MLTVSQAYRNTLPDGPRVATHCDVCLQSGEVIKSLTITPQGSQVIADGTSSIRRTCSLVLADPDGHLTPADANDLLHPLAGNEVRPYRGIQYDTGSGSNDTGGVELLPLGVFVPETTKVDDSGGDVVITITGSDRALKVSGNKLIDIWQISAGTLVTTAVHDLVNAALPGLQYSFQPLPFVTPLVVLRPGDDPLAQAVILTQAVGADLFFDVYGVCTLVQVADPATIAPSWRYSEGPSMLVTDAARSLTRRGVANRVVRDGISTGLDPVTGLAITPPRGLSQDTDPNSPTRVGGTYGTITDYQSSTLYTSQGQAQAASDGALRKGLRSVETVSAAGYVNPALDVGDVIQIDRARLRTGRYVLNIITYPLDTAALQQLSGAFAGAAA